MSELEYISSALFLLGFGNLFLSLRKGLLLTSIFQFAVIVLIFGHCLWLAKQFELYYSSQLSIGYNEVVLTDAIFVGYLFVFFQRLRGRWRMAGGSNFQHAAQQLHIFVEFDVRGTQFFDFFDRMHDRGVVAAAEFAPNLRQ